MAFYQGNLSNTTVILRKTYPIQHLFRNFFKTTYFPGKTYPAQCLFWRKLIQSSIFSGETFQYSIIAWELIQSSIYQEKKFSIQHLFQGKFIISSEDFFNTALHQGAYPVHTVLRARIICLK